MPFGIFWVPVPRADSFLLSAQTSPEGSVEHLQKRVKEADLERPRPREKQMGSVAACGGRSLAYFLPALAQVLFQ